MGRARADAMRTFLEKAAKELNVLCGAEVQRRMIFRSARGGDQRRSLSRAGSTNAFAWPAEVAADAPREPPGADAFLANAFRAGARAH
jgi:hypothetical protein